jgi:hypothetical protein
LKIEQGERNFPDRSFFVSPSPCDFLSRGLSLRWQSLMTLSLLPSRKASLIVRRTISAASEQLKDLGGI